MYTKAHKYPFLNYSYYEFPTPPISSRKRTQTKIKGTTEKEENEENSESNKEDNSMTKSEDSSFFKEEDFMKR